MEAVTGHEMNWSALLDQHRLGEQTEKEEQGYKDFPINAFEQDYHKIISSSAFRRLQDKTQIFPLDDSDFVRTRLTHSIEVSTIAYQMGQMLTENTVDDLLEKYSYEYRHLNNKEKEREKVQKQFQDLKEQRANIPSLLRCAGVLHDLGNPPFGHFGEDTIGMWFHENLDKVKYKGDTLRTWLEKLNVKELRDTLPDGYEVAASHEKLGDEVIANLEHFEGNAQALRLLCKAKYGGDINVSYAVISSLVKYPTDSCHMGKKDPDIKRHKQGVYASEADIFDKIISETMGTKLGTWKGEKDKNPGAGQYCRHPLTFIMEASDDIAYATSDLEDSYKKGMFTLQQLREHFYEKMKKEAEEKKAYIMTYLCEGKSPKEVKAAFDAAFDGDAEKFESVKDVWNNEIWNNDKSDKMLYGRGRHEMGNLWESAKVLQELRKYEDDQGFNAWLNSVRAKLMYCVVYKFLTNLDKIMAGTFKKDLFEDTFQGIALRIMKSAMGKFVYDHPKTSPTEISGHNSLSFLLDGFVHAALYADEKDYKDENGEKQYTDKDNKYWRLISEHFRKDYEQAKSGCEPFDLYLRLLTVTDHISAMTDTYAHDLAAKLRGY